MRKKKFSGIKFSGIPDTITIDCGWYGNLEFGVYELKRIKAQIDQKLKDKEVLQ